IVMAFRRDQSAYVACEGRLREIDPTKTYDVIIYRIYEAEKPVTLKGSTLAQLRLEIDECPGSVLVEYRDAAALGKKSP
ncbi:MAG: hypothetical protein NT154_22005, partial [Verrucomicrobia bacterium]|nr:hypothetical protein [Verrucomicrobiota bacterium]